MTRQPAATEMLTAPINVLICEDCEDDALLIASRLRRDGLQLSYERVETRAAATAALRGRPPDIVISDFNLPGFSAEEALGLLADTGLDVPFILVSGQIGEESAVALLRAGAHDFVLKDKLARLAPAVLRELRDAEDRRQRRRAQAALRESEQSFRLFAEHAQDIIFRYRVHPEPKVEYLSPATTMILGLRPDQLCGDPERLFSRVDPADRPSLEASWRSPDPAPLAVRWRRPDDTTVWTEQRAVGLRDDEGHLVAVEGILRDVTGAITAQQERERLELQLRQAERLEAVGQLAGGVAHDFNNLLGVILGNSGLAISDLPADHPIQNELEGIERAAERGAALTRQLLIFSRSEPPQLETLDLNAVVHDTERLLHRTIGADLDFRTRLAPDLPPIQIDRSRLEQILVNLVVNSRAAMPGGGRLTIETSAAEPGTTTASGAQKPGRRVRLRVTDTGCGMTPEVVQRAFEPFFTTKGIGIGTGLGLSTVYGAVTEAGGEIEIASAPDAGTAITVLLPAANAPPATAPLVQAHPPERPHGDDKTILVVEDEPALRELIDRILARAGYRVVAASSPAHALRTVETQFLRPDALLADVVMPGMSGYQLAEQLLLDHPDLPVLFMSGYTAGALPGGTQLPTGTPLIRKPFTGPDLLDRLQEVLQTAADQRALDVGDERLPCGRVSIPRS